MHIDLSGKSALVTGSTNGIGLAVAQGLANAGAQVTIVGREQSRLDSAITSINKGAGNELCKGIIADAGTKEGCDKVINQLTDVDILINNLGIYGGVDFFDIDDEAWQEMFDVNVMSGIRLARHYAKGMQSRGWGRIQFISSESALNIPAEMVHYGMSKAAMQGVSRGLAKVLAGSGVTVNTVLPGPTRTQGANAMMQKMADERGVSREEMEILFLNENRPSSLLKRFSEPEEIAAMCVYAASKQASSTTGAALRVEGGIVESIA